MSGALEFEGVSKRFGSVQALDNVSFSVQKGEFFSLLGPSGCGKTTLLRMVAGFELPDSGRILLDGQDITSLPPHKRPVNTVFQNYALFPHLTVFENIAFGLRLKSGLTNHAIDKEVKAMLGLIQMEELAHKLPDSISGGQKQRVAIARALVNKPRLLLLDEPLSALDLKLRQRMLFEIDLIHDEVGITFLFVTHDQTEAMAVSDHIAVMHAGCLEQLGSPRELYEQPRSSFVAAFIGDTNFMDGKVTANLENGRFGIQAESLPPLVATAVEKQRQGASIHLSIRPEKVGIGREEPKRYDGLNVLRGSIEEITYKGDSTKYWVRVEEQKFAILQQHSHLWSREKPLEWGEDVWIWWHVDDSYVLQSFDAEDEALTGLPPDEIGEDEA